MAPIFGKLHHFESEEDTLEKHEIKALDLQEIYQYDTGCFFDLFVFIK